MEIQPKAPYMAPEAEALEVQAEGIVCGSGGLNNYNSQPGQNW